MTDPQRTGVLALVEQALAEHLAGPPPARASVSFVGVEPIEVLRFSGADTVTLVTLGLSRRPMGDGPDGPRAELMAEVAHRDRDSGLWRRLAVLAAAPVVEGVVYTVGMTVDLGEPIDATSICTGGLILASELPAVSTPEGEVALLRFTPATSTELAYARVHGAAALGERWEAAGTDLRTLSRSSVDLSG